MMFGSSYHEEHQREREQRAADAAEAPRLRRENERLRQERDDARADVERLREALREIANAERVENADAGEWAVWAHDLAREALTDDD